MSQNNKFFNFSKEDILLEKGYNFQSLINYNSINRKNLKNSIFNFLPLWTPRSNLISSNSTDFCSSDRTNK
jgi:hypothetical protein